MNKKILYSLLPAICLFVGCSENNIEEHNDELVPISLMADGVGTSVVTRATDVVGVTLFASTVSGDYTLTGDYNWNREAEIASDGSVALSPEVFYPNTGDWIHIVGVSKDCTLSDGKVGYDMSSGLKDLIYSKEVRGNKWKIEQFGPNKKLEFIHLCTQLEFVVKAVDPLPNGGMKISKIVVKDVNKKAEVTLKDGAIAWSENSDLSLTEDHILSTIDEKSIKIVMLPPSPSYKLAVETNIGTFTGTIAPSEGEFIQGHSHKVTLSFSNVGFKAVTIAVDAWKKNEEKVFEVN